MSFVATATPATLPALTGLRGVAALWVVFFHSSLGAAPLLHAGYLGVDLFFILSGFILSYVYARTMRPTSVADYVRFLKVRFARIYPLHVFVLCVLALLVVAWPGFAESFGRPELRWSLSSFVASLLLIQNWAYFLPTCWNTPAWSLSAEWLAYLTFPLFLLATHWPRSKAMPIVMLIAALAVMIAVLMSRGIYGLEGNGTSSMVRMACEFATGCLLWRATANGLGRLPLAADIAAVALLAWGALLVTSTFVMLPAFCLFVLLGSQGSEPVAKALATGPVVFLGKISYSLYLTHWTVLAVTERLGVPDLSLDGIVIPLATIALCVVLATLCYRWIELPSTRWGRRLGARQQA